MTTENAVSSAMTRRDVLKGAAALSAAGVAASALPLTHAVAAEEVTDAEGNLTVAELPGEARAHHRVRRDRTTTTSWSWAPARRASPPSTPP